MFNKLYFTFFCIVRECGLFQLLGQLLCLKLSEMLRTGSVRALSLPGAFPSTEYRVQPSLAGGPPPPTTSISVLPTTPSWRRIPVGNSAK
ncbi:hypothetical protein K1T71_014477 [Dendrolimus kikuchii]|uniref:Uncharacterized protein n=1 Tax=Dendrolimus kikuchii TaxID=765133 RepID=A0ACC1CEA9_9NEOP|nr:hypothetical protein K1T71_014477 [Dendrolimus kikuchii]